MRERDPRDWEYGETDAREDALARAQEYTAKKMDDIKTRFRPGAKITVLVRTPTNDEADFIMTDDDLTEAVKALQRRIAP